MRYHDNEDYAINMAGNLLPYYGYDEVDVKRIAEIIASTKLSIKPKTLLQKIMCDADHDYLGRADYYQVAKKLREERENQGSFMTEIEWVDFQLHFLTEIHEYYTETAINIRQGGKKARILELKKRREELAHNLP
jgi:hypothetical protein